ncbi:hypothetical protein A2U01_0071270, partial [Trifolium medium]|nr:hypothetical protein [Trifolium medium]
KQETGYALPPARGAILAARRTICVLVLAVCSGASARRRAWLRVAQVEHIYAGPFFIAAAS